MGRPRKAQMNEVIRFNGEHGVVVDYRDGTNWGRYLTIRTDPLGRYAHGAPIWVDSTDLEATGRKSKRPGITYRHNKRLEPHRGCVCQCCAHISGFADEG